jgi:hypothetical protein
VAAPSQSPPSESQGAPRERCVATPSTDTPADAGELQGSGGKLQEGAVRIVERLVHTWRPWQAFRTAWWALRDACCSCRRSCSQVVGEECECDECGVVCKWCPQFGRTRHRCRHAHYFHLTTTSTSPPLPPQCNAEGGPHRCRLYLWMAPADLHSAPRDLPQLISTCPNAGYPCGSKAGMRWTP